MINYSPIIENLASELFSKKNIKVDVLRLDLIHSEVSGNKWFKLKYNLLAAQKMKLNTILTFGGAYSNHVAATAAACKLVGFKSIGIIRGEESSSSNETLSEAKKAGMDLHFVSREKYKQKEDQNFIKELIGKFGEFYLIPEGGNNKLGILGCAEILNETINHNYIFCAVGTETTFLGLQKSIKSSQKLIGINVLKSESDDPFILCDYHFGGYAKHTPELLQFKSDFENEFKIPLDHVYTSKLFYGVFDLIKKDMVEKNSSILIIHSGGLQGNAGYEKRYNLKPSR